MRIRGIRGRLEGEKRGLLDLFLILEREEKKTREKREKGGESKLENFEFLKKNKGNLVFQRVHILKSPLSAKLGAH